jgi:hypothetical protein
MARKSQTVFDRRVAELPINARAVPVEVDDPYTPADQDKPDRIVVMRSVRDDPLGFMHARRQIDDVHLLAGRYWEQLHQRACIGAIQALDTSKEPVDGGAGFPDPITDSQRSAIDKLRSIEVALVKSVGVDRNRGKDRVRLIGDILGLGMLPTQAAAIRGKCHWRQVKKLAREFRSCLDVVACELNLTSHLPKWQI